MSLRRRCLGMGEHRQETGRQDGERDGAAASVMRMAGTMVPPAYGCARANRPEQKEKRQAFRRLSVIQLADAFLQA